MLINLSFYDNQEAMERSFLTLSVLAILSGYGMWAILFSYTALQSEDEDRFYEEMHLDTSELGIHYTLNLQKEKIENYYRVHNQGYFNKEEDVFHDYLTDDYIFEREMLDEIYEFPISTIISNNYYLVPSDERSFTYFQELLRAHLTAQYPPRGKFTTVSYSNFFASVVKPRYKNFGQPWVLLLPAQSAFVDELLIYFYGNFNYRTQSLDHINYYQKYLNLPNVNTTSVRT